MEEVEEEESVGERYAKMAKHDKLALLMIALGPDAASTLLKRFDAKDAENICKRMKTSNGTRHAFRSSFGSNKFCFL